MRGTALADSGDVDSPDQLSDDISADTQEEESFKYASSQDQDGYVPTAEASCDIQQGYETMEASTDHTESQNSELIVEKAETEDEESDSGTPSKEQSTDGSDFVLLDSPTKQRGLQDDNLSHEEDAEKESVGDEAISASQSESDNSPFHHIEIQSESTAADSDLEDSRDGCSDEKIQSMPEEMPEEMSSHTQSMPLEVSPHTQNVNEDSESDSEDSLLVENNSNNAAPENCAFSNDGALTEATDDSHTQSYGAVGPEITDAAPEWYGQEDGSDAVTYNGPRYVYSDNFDPEDETF